MFRLALHWQILLGVVVAAVIGVALNRTVSERESVTELREGRFLVARDSVDRIEVRIEDAAGEVIAGQHFVVDPSGREFGPGVFLTLDHFRAAEPEAYRLFYDHARSPARKAGDFGYAIGDLFLRLLKMVAVPLIITSLMTGVLGLADAGRLRRMFGMTLGYYLVTSMLAITTGIVLVNLIRPGVRAEAVERPDVAVIEPEGLGATLYRQLQAMIPENPFQAVAQADFLSIIAFTLAFAIFTILVGGRVLELLREFFAAGFGVMMRMTMGIIYLAPYGVFGLMLYATATQGIGVFQQLGWYMLTVFLGLVIHGAVTLSIVLYLFGGRSPREYARAMSPALLTAFSSSSSNATLPVTLSCVETRAGIDNRVGSFVLPLGATVNMDGTALFEVVAVLFIAQLEPDINLTLTQQVLVAITALLASIGAAGIPAAGLVMMVIVLQAVGLPTDRVALILAVDRVLDMTRTVVNVWSDSCGCAVVARYNGGPGATQEVPAEPQPAPQATAAQPATVTQSPTDGEAAKPSAGSDRPAVG